jgi:MerR family transcriptional regulator, copper efflux regulator
MPIQPLPESQEGHPHLPSTTRPLTIGQLARLTGIAAKNIRYYEAIGLLPSPARASNSYRCYHQADVNRLTLLRRLRLLGVPLMELSPLLNGASNARCIEVLQDLLPLVAGRLAALDQEIAELEQLRLQVKQYHHQLVNCHPNEHESFSACLNTSCIALSDEILPEEESHETTCCV